MGDFLSPKKRDVFDRLRRRIELYRRHHDGCHSRYEPTVNGTWDQHREDIRLLRQRWLESKAKKATSKHSKSSKDPSQETRTQLLSLQQRPSKKKNMRYQCVKRRGPITHKPPTVLVQLFATSSLLQKKALRRKKKKK